MKRKLIARCKKSDEAGVTLVELLVVIGLLGVLGGIVVAGIVGGMRTTTYGQQRVNAIANAQMGIERISRELRAADPLRVAETDRVALDVRRAGGLHHFTYEITGTPGNRDLTETRRTFGDPDVFDAPGFDPVATTPDAVTTRVLVTGIRDDDVFVYFDTDGEEFVPPSARSVRRVQIAIERIVTAGRRPVRVETLVKVRNA